MTTDEETPEETIECVEPELGLNDVVGLDEQIATLKTEFVSGIEAELFGGPTGHHFALIRGPVGANTERLATGVADAVTEYGFDYYRLDAAPGGCELIDMVEDAANSSPAVIQIDEFDDFCGADLDRFRTLHREVREAGKKVVFIAVSKCVHGHGVHRHFANAEHVRSEDIAVTVPPLDGSRRIELLKDTLQNADLLAAVDLTDDEWATLSDVTEEFRVNDIHKVASRVAIRSNDGPETVDGATVLAAARDVREEAEHLSEETEDDETSTRPAVTFDDIGGLDDTIERLKREVLYALEHRERYEKMGLDVDTGALLYGPPGTGKTLLAKAFANETDRYFVHMDGNDVTSKWYGQSEENLHAFFEEARENAPSLVFIDELDSIAPQRGATDGPGADERIVSQLLRELDGMEPLDDVFVLGATNRPDRVDDALLRSGRLGDEHIEVLPPAEEAAQAEIFDIHLRDRPTANDLTPAWAAEQIPGRPSGSLIENICDKAANEAVWPPEESDPVITRADFEAALDDVRHLWEEEDAVRPTYH